MEDAHTAVLNLEEGAADGNTFFAVYDGHGGACFSVRTVFRSALSSFVSTPPSPFVAAGSAVAKYAGINLHKRLVQGAAYKNKDYALSIKEAFIGTDTDMRSSAYTTMLFAIYFHTSLLHLPCQVLIFQEMPLGARQ